MFYRLRRVAGQTHATAVHHPEVVVRRRITPRSGLAVPMQSLVVIARKTRDRAVQVAQVELRPHMPLMRSAGVPVLGLHPVGRSLLRAQHTHAILSRRFTRVGTLRKVGAGTLRV